MLVPVTDMMLQSTYLTDNVLEFISVKIRFNYMYQNSRKNRQCLVQMQGGRPFLDPRTYCLINSFSNVLPGEGGNISQNDSSLRT